MIQDPTDIHAEQDRIQEEADRQKRSLRGREADWVWLMSNKRGRRIVWRILEDTNVFGSSMTGNSYTFHNEGRRSYGIEVHDIVREKCAKDYALMLEEQRDYDK